MMRDELNKKQIDSAVIPLKKTDLDRFRKGILGVIDTFKSQEFGNSREFAFGGLKGTINMMIDSLVNGEIDKVVVFASEVEEKKNEKVMG